MEGEELEDDREDRERHEGEPEVLMNVAQPHSLRLAHG